MLGNSTASQTARNCPNLGVTRLRVRVTGLRKQGNCLCFRSAVRHQQENQIRQRRDDYKALFFSFNPTSEQATLGQNEEEKPDDKEKYFNQGPKGWQNHQLVGESCWHPNQDYTIMDEHEQGFTHRVVQVHLLLHYHKGSRTPIQARSTKR